LRLLIEAESLLNDGTAAVAFVAVLAILAGAHQNPLSITGSLLLTIAGGTMVGASVAFILMFLAGRTPDYLVEITFTMLAAYGSFLLADHYHFSGVLATLTAGLVVGNYRSSTSISDAGRQALGPFGSSLRLLRIPSSSCLLERRKRSNTSRGFGCRCWWQLP